MPYIGGTTSDDALTGTEDLDDIYGFAGNDTLTGLGSGDYLVGGVGADTLLGGEGNDVLWSTELDIESSDADLDILTGGGGDDTVYLGLGDSGSGGDGFDTVYFNFNAATTGLAIDLAAPDREAQLVALGGFTVSGFEAINLVGTRLADALYGSADAETFFGHDGNDGLYGGLGDDRLFGMVGDDLLNGGPGADQMSGGSGHDTYIVDDAGDHIDEYFDEGTDTINSHVSLTIAANIEQLFLLGGGDLNANGNSSANMLVGNTGSNTLNGGDGDDLLYGMDGADVLVGGAGADFLMGGEGADTFRWSHTLESSIGSAFDALGDFASGLDRLDVTGTGVGRTALVRSGGSTFVYFGASSGSGYGGVVQVLGSVQGYDVIDTAGVILFGAATGETLFGGSRDDYIAAGGGDDYLVGSAGSDVLYGEAGADTFAVDRLSDSTTTAFDVFADFVSGVDRIDLTLLVTAGYSNLALARLGGTTFIYFSLPGAAVYPGAFQVLDEVQGSDLLLGSDLGLVFYGSGGSDDLRGAAGADTLLGGDGADLIRGGLGADSLFGGVGADVFAYGAAADSTATHYDSLQDFQAGIDKVDLRGVASEVTLSSFGGATFIYFNPNGSGGYDGLIVAVGATLTQDDIMVTGEATAGLGDKVSGHEAPTTCPPVPDAMANDAWVDLGIHLGLEREFNDPHASGFGRGDPATASWLI